MEGKAEMMDMTYLKGYEGQWVALTPDLRQIVGNGKTLAEAAAGAAKKGVANPVFEKVPPANCGLAMSFSA